MPPDRRCCRDSSICTLISRLRLPAAFPGDWGKSLKAYLACGVTTVNDYATYGEMFVPMRQLLASGAVPGPHVNMAVRMSTPGGHGTEAGWGDFMTLTAATPDAGAFADESCPAVQTGS